MNLSKYNCNKQNKYETIKIRKRKTELKTATGIVSFSIFVARKRFIVEYDIFSHSIVIVTKEIDVNNLDVIVAVNKSERMVVNKKERETLITVVFMDTSPESGRTIIFCSISTPQIIKIPKIKL